jgi:hypothetical protein
MGCASSSPKDGIDAKKPPKAPEEPSAGATMQVEAEHVTKKAAQISAAKDNSVESSDGKSQNNAAIASSKGVSFRNEIIFDHADDSYLSFSPKIGYLIKTRSTKEEMPYKIFINIFHDKAVETFLSAVLDQAYDKSNNDCWVYNVVIPTYIFEATKLGESLKMKVV